MTATGRTPADTDPSDSDRAYFEAIEETFIRLRGAPLLLSPADWQVARRWHREGVPLELVRRTLEGVFALRRERGARGRIQSLRYCAPAVDAAWAELREMQAPGERAPATRLDVPARLAALAAALPADLEGGEAWAERVRGVGLDPEAVEAALAAIDGELLDRAEQALTTAARERLEQRVEDSVAALAARLPPAEIEAARSRLLRRLLRRDVGLPVLSLFAPEAEAADPAAEAGG
jgi:hypothetical protein